MNLLFEIQTNFPSLMAMSKLYPYSSFYTPFTKVYHRSSLELNLHDIFALVNK